MSDAGTLVLKVPSDWKDTSVVAAEGAKAASVLDFSTRDDSGPLRMQIVSFPPAKITPELAGDEGLRKICEITAKSYVAGSKEKKLTLVDFEGDESHGFTYSLTRADEGPYKCVTGGAVKIGEIVLIISIHHQMKQPSVDTVLDMLRHATLGAGETGKPTTQPAEPVELVSADGSWSVRVPKLMMSPSKIYRRVNGATCQFGGGDNELRLTLNALFEPAAKRGGATIARNYYHTRLKQARAPIEKVKLEGNDQKSILRYQLSGTQYASVYMVHEKTWAGVHFACEADDKEARALIEAAIASIVISPRN